MVGLKLRLERSIKAKRARVCVVGMGYVGLPLALEFCFRGFQVYGIEKDHDRLKRLLKKKTYITDVSSALLRKAWRTGRIGFSASFSCVAQSEIIVVCVPTPLKRKNQPDISFIRQAVQAIAKQLKPGSLVILESTTYPGTTEEVILPLLEKSGLRHGKDFFLSFSPERIDPGNKDFPVHKIPKVIGGINPDATRLAALFYSHSIDNVVPVSSSRVAEAVKLLENTYRLVNIALIDEMAMMANHMGIDIWEVIDAAKTKPFGFMPFYPGPGCGGHCIPKDPLYLYWKAASFGFKSRFIRLASGILDFMPHYCVDRVAAELRRRGIPLKNASVLVVGVTYKKNVLDLRKSPSIEIIRVLQQRRARVSYHDPIIPYLSIPGINLRSVSLNAKTLSGIDCVIIGADHSSLDYVLLSKHARLVFDTRNVYKGKMLKNIIKL